MIKTLFLRLSLLLLLVPTFASAQKVDSVTINGVQVYVYPFEQEVDEAYQYWYAVDNKNNVPTDFTYEDYLRDVRGSNLTEDELLTEEEFEQLLKVINAKTYRTFSKYFLDKLGPKPSKKEFKRYKKRSRKSSKYNEESSYFDKKKFKKAVRANPYDFLIQRVAMDQDITPMLDPIPDGTYIQYYESFCLLQKDGSCKMINDQIAGYFTIKNNVLNGEATWVDLQGDTLKHGNFVNGLKEGEWFLIERRIGYFDEYMARAYVDEGYMDIDTTINHTTFKNGIRNGNYSQSKGEEMLLEVGSYKEGEMNGEWTFNWTYGDWEYIQQNDGKWATRIHYVLNDDDSLIVHPVIVRDNLVPKYDFDPVVYDMYPEYSIPTLPKLYEAAFPRAENLDLEEEMFIESEYDGEYYGDEYYEGEMYDEGYYGDEEYLEMPGIEISVSNPRVFDPVDKTFKLRTLVYDSLGAYPVYQDVYESFYPNGQLAFRFEFENGMLINESPIYWDNGKVHDEVLHDEDSSTYTRNVYDYTGLLAASLRYDSLGNFTRNYDDYERTDLISLDGLTFSYGGYNRYYIYDIPDSVLDKGLNGRTIIGKYWSAYDSTAISQRYYDPETQEVDQVFFNLMGGSIEERTLTFSEGFKSWTGNGTRHMGDFHLKSVRSASLKDWAEVDSIPVHMLTSMYSYNVTSDFTLYYEDQPLSGPFKINLEGKKMKLSKKSATLPFTEKAGYYVNGVNMKHKLKGKITDELTLSSLGNAADGFEGYQSVYFEMFLPVLGNNFRAYRNSRNVNDWDGRKIKKADQEAYASEIEGYFLDGKPQGVWKMYDQFGKLMRQASFEKGELNGKTYRYEYQNSEEEAYFNMDDIDTMPAKRTYFLAGTAEYVNGELNGTRYQYDWLGRVTNEDNFKEGYQEGVSIERNHLAVSMSEYKYGAPDGYSKTYLTLPKKDSILLFDLNFQNGQLQGESRSYHTNGKIAKRGFFLQGEPIDDYEAFDTLGTLYHYVKFQYGFPVEEKLWEENELSVRYMFDWEDSIYFVPLNITESESLDALLVEAGLSYGREFQPYYGRQAIVDKDGIDYHMTKYYPNDTIARVGQMVEGKKAGLWEFFSYDGDKLYEVNYFDTLLVVNDSIKFNSKGIYTGLDSLGNVIYRSYIIEKSERFDCSHKDHYEVRQLYTIWELEDSLRRMNGEVLNYYDNGTLQSYGVMKDGLPHGDWRYYDPAGKLNKYGNYVLGKRNGRWLSGDLSKTKYLGEICLNPNMPDLEEELRYRENFLDVQVINYKMGRELQKEYYDINMNRFIQYDEDEEELEEEVEEWIEEE